MPPGRVAVGSTNLAWQSTSRNQPELGFHKECGSEGETTLELLKYCWFEQEQKLESDRGELSGCSEDVREIVAALAVLL